MNASLAGDVARRTSAGRVVLAAVLLVVVGAAAVLVLALTGDGDGDVFTGKGDGTPASGWVGTLDLVPDVEDAWGLSFVDITRALALRDVERPAPDAGMDEREEAFGRLTGDPGSVSLTFGAFFRGFGPAELRAELGFDHLDIDHVVSLGDLGPPTDEGRLGGVAVMTGRFDPASIDDTVRADPDWGPLLEQRSHRDVTYYAWGSDGDQDVRRRTRVRPLGRSHQLYVSDTVVVHTYWTDDMEHVLDTLAGRKPSLAGRPELVRIGSEIDRAGIYSGHIAQHRYLTAGAEPPDHPDPPRLRRPVVELTGFVLSRRPREDVLTPAFTALLLQASDDDARANKERLRRRLDEPAATDGRPLDRDEIIEVSTETNGALFRAHFFLRDLRWDRTQLRGVFQYENQ